VVDERLQAGPGEVLHVAIDLGAGSGRALLGGVGPAGLHMTEVHRFHYAPRKADGHLRWDVAGLAEGVRAGLRHAHDAALAAGASVVSVGVDSWGVDYALIDAHGDLVEEPYCYRDSRTDRTMDEVFAIVPRAEVFARTGIQFHQFNTLYQLFAHAKAGLPAHAARLLLIPDFCHHLLCGSEVTERTNASTTQLLDAATGDWDDELFERLGLPRHLMGDLVAAGTSLGTLRPGLARALGVSSIRVVAPGTHDTASAVAGAPLAPGWAYISSGTWSLVGVERSTPVLTEDAARAGLTNEAGVFGSIRLLTNVMGLWLLESCRREWEAAGQGQDLSALLGEVARIDEPAGVVFPDDRAFFAPESMVRALRSALTSTGQADTDDPARLAKVVLDSLALRYASVVSSIERLTGQPIPGIHIVGGGSMNDYLNQATADASGREVLAGPAEATATGNLLVQAIASGTVASLAEGRRRVAAAFPPRRFVPRRREQWSRLAERYRELETAHH
jgi:rhamnulokinase